LTLNWHGVDGELTRVVMARETTLHLIVVGSPQTRLVPLASVGVVVRSTQVSPVLHAEPDTVTVSPVVAKYFENVSVGPPVTVNNAVAEHAAPLHSGGPPDPSVALIW
jgi:hypothetical protein